MGLRVWWSKVDIFWLSALGGVLIFVSLYMSGHKQKVEPRETRLTYAELADLEVTISQAEKALKAGEYNDRKELAKTVIGNMKALAGSCGSTKYHDYVPNGSQITYPSH